jgi:hypothetical protein
MPHHREGQNGIFHQGIKERTEVVAATHKRSSPSTMGERRWDDPTGSGRLTRTMGVFSFSQQATGD